MSKCLRMHETQWKKMRERWFYIIFLMIATVLAPARRLRDDV